MGSEIQPVVTAPMAVAHEEPQRVALMGVLQSALDKGTNPEAIKVVGELIERMEDRWAERAFATAKADFQAECPLVRKTTTASIVSQKKGTRYKYNYAELPEIERTIAPYRHKHGLSYEWDTEESQSGRLFCVCVVRHVGGHKAKSRVPCTVDNAAAMTDPQKQGSAMTYSKRQSLIAAFGLTACDPDDDGAGGTAAVKPISPNQVLSLNDAIIAAEANVSKFKAAFEIKELDELPVDQYERAMGILEKQRLAKQAEKDKP